MSTVFFLNKKCFLTIFISLFLLPKIIISEFRYQIGASDWMMLKRQTPGAFELCMQFGCDGVEMDMGPLGDREAFENKFRNETEAKQFLDTIRPYGIKVGVVAMSGFYAQNLGTRENYMSLIEDCFNTMDKVGNVKVAFLPLGGCGNDWSYNKLKRENIVQRLHNIGEVAKARGKIVGIDTPLNAKENLKLLKEINSEGISIFYKFQTIIENGWDILKDLKKLGAKNICGIHATNTDGVWLKNDPAMNMTLIKHTLDEMGWKGWIFVERSRDASMVRNTKMNYGANVRYLKEIFNSYPEPTVKLNSEGRDPEYVKTILERSQKATDELSITWTLQGQNVLNIIANKYFKLNDIYEERDKLKNENKELAEAQCDSKLYRSHFEFNSQLSMYLKQEEIDKIKDIMTYNVVKVTYDAQNEMILSLTEEEKKQIMIWLLEARELAIDAESSNKKHEMFGKYKGRINNYLSARGYNLTKEREEWYKRIKEKEENENNN